MQDDADWATVGVKEVNDLCGGFEAISLLSWWNLILNNGFCLISPGSKIDDDGNCR